MPLSWVLCFHYLLSCRLMPLATSGVLCSHPTNSGDSVRLAFPGLTVVLSTASLDWKQHGNQAPFCNMCPSLVHAFAFISYSLLWSL